MPWRRKSGAIIAALGGHPHRVRSLCPVRRSGAVIAALGGAAALLLLSLRVPAFGENGAKVGASAYSTANAAVHRHQKPKVLAPGYGPLEFRPPPAGSYTLPPLGAASDGEVLDSTGAAFNLHRHLQGKIVVLSFIYTSCNDINGCPLATHVLSSVQNHLLAAADIRSQVRLISLSFDPRRDTPEVLKNYAGHFRQPGFDWRFLTTRSEARLAPLLRAYDQWVIRDPTGAMSHLLRVYLIDRDKRIRNIYSVSFLHADTLLNDIRTLLLEAGQAAAAGLHGTAHSPGLIVRELQ